MTATRLPSIPDISTLGGSVSPSLRTFLASLATVVNTREGLLKNSDSKDRAVTFRDLEGDGVARAISGNTSLMGSIATGVSAGGGVASGPAADEDLTPPPNVSNVVVEASMTGVMVTFDQPSYNKAGTTSSNHAYTMMYMADANGDGSSPGFAASKPTGQSSGPVIFAPIGTGRVVYCWLRNISKADVSGPISGGASGYKATTPVSPSVYINLLNGAAFDGLTIKQNGFRVSSPDGTKQVTPFSVLTQDTVMGGITVPAGVYMDGAHIVNLEASVARLGAATIDEAKIGALSVSKIRTDTMTAAFANVVVGQFGTLSAINSNLGTVTAGTLSSAVSYLGKVSADQISAGTITSSISVSTEGYISASGAGVTGSFGRQATVKGQCSASLGAAGVCGVATGQSSAGVYGAATASGGVGGYFEATGLAGIGVYASGTSADILLMGSKTIAFDANRTVQIRSDGTNLRMSDSSTTDAYLVMVSSYSLSSGSGAVLGSKHPSAPSNSQRGWLVGTCQGQTIYQPFW